MTDQSRKAAERERRKKAGEVRIEAWISASSARHLVRLKKMTKRTTSEVVDYALDATGHANR